MKDIATNMPDYEYAYANERLEVPEYFNFGFDVVDKWAEDRTKLALLSVDSSGENVQHHTFWDLKILSNKYANALRDRGIKKGDRVLYGKWSGTEVQIDGDDIMIMNESDIMGIIG